MNSRKFHEIPMKIHQNQNENDQFQQNLAKSQKYAKKIFKKLNMEQCEGM